MTDIYLVRHGEAAASWGQAADPGLSPLGHEQAIAAARTLQPLLAGDAVQLISSPLARARETSAPLASELGQTVTIDTAFTEIKAPVPLAERQPWLRQFMAQRWDQQPQSLHQWRDQALMQLIAFDSTVVVFTHFLVINAVVGDILAVPETLCCWPDNGSITQLRKNGRRLELVALGEQMLTVVN